MNQILQGFRNCFPRVSPAEQEFASYASEQDVEQMAASLAESGYSGLGKVCYVLGSGGQPRSAYSQLKGTAGIHVAIAKSLLPFGLRWIPSYRGLVRIDDASKLWTVFDELTVSIATIYIFDTSLEDAFVDAVRRGTNLNCSFVVKQDPG